MRGIVIDPMAATADDAIPEIAPNTAVVTTTTKPSPLRKRPKKLSANSSSRTAIPPCVMMAPARM